ncbi:hypothetical protein ACFL6Y_03795 [Elusimicrobiota bacterium]
MKKLYTLTLILLVSFPLIAKKTESKKILSVKKEFVRINANLKKLDKVEKTILGLATQGAQMTAYYRGKKIVRMDLVFQGETEEALEEYYFKSSKLILAYHKTIRRAVIPEACGDTVPNLDLEKEPEDEIMAALCDDPGPQKDEIENEDRFYFHKEKLMRWVDKTKSEIAPDKKKQGELLKQAKYYVDLIGAFQKKNKNCDCFECSDPDQKHTCQKFDCCDSK